MQRAIVRPGKRQAGGGRVSQPQHGRSTFLEPEAPGGRHCSPAASPQPRPTTTTAIPPGLFPHPARQPPHEKQLHPCSAACACWRRRRRARQWLGAPWRCKGTAGTLRGGSHPAGGGGETGCGGGAVAAGPLSASVGWGWKPGPRRAAATISAARRQGVVQTRMANAAGRFMPGRGWRVCICYSPSLPLGEGTVCAGCLKQPRAEWHANAGAGASHRMDGRWPSLLQARAALPLCVCLRSRGCGRSGAGHADADRDS